MIVFISLLGILLRLISLDQSLWLDETISAMAVKSYDYLGLLIRFAPGDVHPPLYYLLLKLWTNIFGYSEISLRMPSVIAGILTLFVVYKIGIKLFEKKTVAVAALFLAINPLAVYYSQEARMYALAMLFVAIAVYAFVSKKWFLFFVALLASFYTDYITALILPVFFLLAGDKKKTFLLYCGLFIAVIPWVPTLFSQFQASFQLSKEVPLWGQVVGGFDWKSLPLILVKFIIGRISIDNKTVYLLTLGPISIIYAWLAARAKNSLLWLWLIAPIILGFMVSIKIPIFAYHRFLFTLPAFTLLLAAGVKKDKLAMTFVLLVSLVSLAIFNLNSSFQREDWRSAVKYMESDPGIAVIPSLAQASPITYYNNLYPVYDKDNLTLSYQTPVYLIRYVQGIFDPQDLERNLLETAGYKNVQEKDFNGVVIWKYQI